MAANHTFLRTEFNENTQKVDAALGQTASASALNSLAQTVAGKGNCSIVTGSYTGTGEFGEEHPCVLDFAQSVGKPPLLLYVTPEEGDSEMMLACRGQKEAYPSLLDSAWGKSLVELTWTATGVKWSHWEYPYLQLNSADKKYLYVALF